MKRISKIRISKINKMRFSVSSGKQKRPLRPFLWALSLIIILTVGSACDMMESEAGTASNSALFAVGAGQNAEPERHSLPGNYGYDNSSYRYFYYPPDNAIYYMSANSVYRMDINGANSVLIKSNPQQDSAKSSFKFQFIYVSGGRVYSNDRLGNTTYSMKTDGTEHAVERTGRSGPMGVYGSGENAVLYFDSRKKHLEDDTLYFSGGLSNLSTQSLSGDDGPSVLTSGQADNFVFTPEGIYFRLREALSGRGAGGLYGIMKVDYDAEPQGTGAAARLEAEDIEEVVNPGANGIHQSSEPKVRVLYDSSRSPAYSFYSFNTLNVSRDFVAYIRRSIDNDNGANRILEGGLNVISRSGEGSEVPRTVRAGLNKFYIAGGISIIGDYIYWMTDDSNLKQYKLYRVKKDGTGYGLVKNMPY